MMSASEASTLQPNTPVQRSPPVANTSKVPLLGEGFQESKSVAVPLSTENSDLEHERTNTTSGGGKHGKRRLFGFGKKKDDNKSKVKEKFEPASNMDIGIAQTQMAAPVPQRAPLQNTSPQRSSQHYPVPSSPQRNLSSSSPRVVSPAGSQIFERDVQESSSLPPNSPAIPSHIQTENHIPPVLDASSEAITNNNLDPDSVEIVMHSSHQPAAVTVTGIGSSEPTGGNWADELVAHPDKDDAASNYGALDSADVRRLSFISFSDIVQSEHAEHTGGRDSIYAGGLNTLSSGVRSPSPVRSPVSSQGFNTSPPTSKSASIMGVDMSPRSKALGSPTSMHGNGELTIETMAQTIRRTGSGDLSGVRSQPLSPASPDGFSDRAFR
ncbi:hypothetical protein HYFRA_00001116 [Hymenoscyphus fraxineus]|uniref:Gtpase activating protein n=1 Tax=Hymenoscyphus fraxineus TaxID=746836 RepID=A0A9N9PQR4_9HELO|nr:hypothetical protein HYFRA_00001116 [Hymenoscyphus fraxineus]